MKDFDYDLERNASNGTWFDKEAFSELDVNNIPGPTDEQLEQLKKELNDKGWLVK